MKARSLKLCFSFFKLYIVIPVWWPWPNFDVAGTWAFHQLSCLFGGLDLILTWQRQRRHKTARCNFLGSSHLIRFKLCVFFFTQRLTQVHHYTQTLFVTSAFDTTLAFYPSVRYWAFLSLPRNWTLVFLLSVLQSSIKLWILTTLSSGFWCPWPQQHWEMILFCVYVEWTV